MAHVGQEYGLCLVCRLRFILKAGKPFREQMLFGLIVDPYRRSLVCILIIKRHE